MQYSINCSACGEPSHDMLNFRCASCGGPLGVQLSSNFEVKAINKSEWTVWRYAKFFPYVKKIDIVTLGEGWTPLVKFSRRLYFKLENLNPTNSFKDRGSTVLISALQRIVRKADSYVSEDSSGNAGASIAAYAARARLKAKIYVPKTVSGPKFRQIQFYGAEVAKVAGSRARVAELAQQTERGKFYIGHILHPLFRDGIRSLAYEIAEQSNWNVPEIIYLPVSAGTLLLGITIGFKHLLESGVLSEMPKIVACQTQQVSPLYHRIKNLSYMPPKKITSVADALVSTDPPLLELMTKRLKEVNGDAVMVNENEVITAFTELARKGFFVEPSSAVAYAGYKKQEKEISKESKAIVVLTGSGLKTTIRPD